jgi:uncharacterized LabA/DUF88 family protein
VLTHVYVDGFNLYFGALRGTPYRWLDPRRLCGLLLPEHRIEHVKYFTAHVVPRPHNPLKPRRQQTYLRALKTLPGLEIILGSYVNRVMRFPLAHIPWHEPPQYVDVRRSIEKGSDVNLAVHFVNDAHLGRFESGVIISNDTDLIEAVRIVKGLGKQVGVLSPCKQPNQSLMREATFVKVIRGGVLAASWSPVVLSDEKGPLHKPESW